MQNNLYSQLAKNNIKKNKATYLPYILSSSVVIALFIILYMIKNQVLLNDFYGARSMAQVLVFGVYVIALFSSVFIFYTNSFLLKRRQNELGLYSVLGMEKKHISKVLSFENLFSGGISLILGVVFGGIFSKLMFAILLNILDLDTSIKLSITIKPIAVTVVLFVIIFGLIDIYNRFKIRKSSPIELIKGGKKGQKEPQSNWLLGILGFVTLGIGYYISLRIKAPIDALFTFFIAVLLVIAGTYLLFTWGSTIIIKLLKRNKSFYYQKNNFISLSNMLYRMKQNAVGLANIAILSTAVLLIVSSTTSLYVGLEGLMDNLFPKDVVTNFVYEEQDTEEVEKFLQNYAEEKNVEINEPMKYHHLFLQAGLDEDSLADSFETDTIYNVNLIPLDDYNRIYDENLSLKNEEVFLSGNIADYNYNQIGIFEEDYQIKEKVGRIDFLSKDDLDQMDIIVANLEELKSIEKMAVEKEEEIGFISSSIKYDYHFDLKGSSEDKMDFTSSLENKLNKEISKEAVVEDKFTTKQDTLSIYGSLFFIGVLLGTVFMVATVLIIYYKQITEGYEDRERFKTLQNVGMSKKEVKNTIKTQVLLTFFLPLLTAIVHVMFAFPLVDKILILFELENTKLFLSLTGIVILLFGIVYAIIYRWTARVYYKIVN